MEVMAQAERELKRLDIIPAASPEYSVIVSYVETIAELPWSKFSEDNLDLDKAQEILDRDHYDLEKVKRRLIEYLAVRKLNPEGQGPILCFLGPPGVGKTSLGQSIADALGRKFARMSLGGMRDEAEIRGHRRTYIGSMPGRIIQELRRAGTRNPVMMLDEIDKVGTDFRGDPASALLEVLDPRQNHAFVDHYLDVPFDLSQVIFIATANYMDGIPGRCAIAWKSFDSPATPNARSWRSRGNISSGGNWRKTASSPSNANGAKTRSAWWSNDYTHEAGVRDLERQIGAVCRARGGASRPRPDRHYLVTPDVVKEALGPEQFVRESALKTSAPGVVTGLAYTPYGGEILHIEATRYPGKGNVTLTGQIGDVMKESVQAALSLVRSRDGAIGAARGRFSRERYSRARPRGRGAERWPVRRHRDVYRARLALQQHTRALRRRDDRRNHFARPGLADRRSERKKPGGDARRNHHRPLPETERKRPRRYSRRGEAEDQVHPGRERGPGAGKRPRTEERFFG